MEVRRTPNTNIDRGQLGYARATPVDASPIAEGLSQLSNSFTELVKRQQEEDLARQEFDLNKALLDEQRRMSEDFVRRQREPERNQTTFADDLDLDYATVHKGLLDRYEEQGYDEKLLRSTAEQLNTMRGKFFAQGLTHQAEQLRAYALEATNDIAVRTSQVVAQDPAAYEQMIEFGRTTIMKNPDLTEAERLGAVEAMERAVRGAGAKSVAALRPSYVLEQLDPEGTWQASQEISVAPAGTKYVAQSGSWQSVPVQVAEALGLDAAEVAAVMSFETGGTFDPKIMGGDGGRYLGLIQFGPEEQQTYGINQDSTPDQWTTAITRFMKDRGFKSGMGIEDFYSTILTGKPGRYDLKDSNGTSVNSAVPVILAKHKEKADRWFASGGVERIEEIEVPPSKANQRPAVEGVEQETGSTEFNPSQAMTTDPLFNAMTGEERIQVLGWALESKRKESAAEKARLDIAISNVKAEALATGEVASTVPTDEEILRVYGPERGEQIIAEVQQTLRVGGSIQKFRTMSPAAINGQLAKLEPEPGSPTYATELQVYEAAQTAADRLLSEREDDPAAYALKYFPSVSKAAAKGEKEYYAALDRVFETLGINPDEVSPLPKSAADKIADDWQLKQPAEKVKFFMDNFSTMGEDRFQKFIMGLEGTTAEREARMFAALRTSIGKTAFTQILEGAEAIRKDPSRRPNFEGMRTNYRQELQDALSSLNSDFSAAVQDAAAAYYAFQGGDPKTIDAKLYRESLRIALGNREIANMRSGKVRDYTILPVGVTEEKFETWLETLQPRSLTKLSVEKLPPVYGNGEQAELIDIVDHGVFVMTSPDHYMIKMTDDGLPLKTNTGRTFIVRLPKGTIK